MNDAFELLDPRNAQAYMKGFRSSTRRKGEALFRSSRVQNIVPEKPGMAYAALVKDGALHKVDLLYDAVEGWSGNCSCDEEFDCEHVFAAMRALLAEHSTAAVRNLSAGLSHAGGTAPRASVKAEEAGSLDRRLMAALGRPLDATETKF